MSDWADRKANSMHIPVDVVETVAGALREARRDALEEAAVIASKADCYSCFGESGGCIEDWADGAVDYHEIPKAIRKAKEGETTNEVS